MSSSNSTIHAPQQPTQAEAHLEPFATVRRAFPGCAVLSFEALRGGVSAGATRLDLVLGDGSRKQVVVRRPTHVNGSSLLPQGRAAAEYAVLHVAHAAGVAAPRPCFLDPSGDSLVLDYVEGAPDLALPWSGSKLQQAAQELARIHALSPIDADLSFLSKRWQSAEHMLKTWPVELDQSLNEGEIRRALSSSWPAPRNNREVLLHGDYWPGNLVWRDEQLAAVIDWEEAELGDALADLAIARLDLLWAFGVEAMHEFTERYAALTELDWAALPYWDLLVTLRPMSNLARWASSYPLLPLNRPDIDDSAMQRGHSWFVEHALQRLPRLQ